MAINKKLIFWKSSTFNPPTSSSDTTKDVLWSAIVFFDSTAGTYANSIWTHGKVFSPGTWGTNQTNYVPLTISGTTYNLSKDGHTHNYAGSATVGGSATTSKALIGDDTRSTNSAPSVYMSWGTRYVGYVGNQTEFKQISVIGAGTFLTGAYCFLETKNPWSDSSGGLPIQVAYGPGTPCWRIATDASTWGAWQALNSGGNADKLDGYHASSAATADTIVQRDANGYIYGVYINSTRGDENSAAASYIYDSGDGWMRKKTLANVKNELVTKAQIESVLTGNLTTHTHSYLPLAGGTLTGQINLTTTTITTPQANTIALAAKSDGLYQKLSTGVESKLSIDGHTHSYLPLAGGTLTGDTTFNTNIIANNGIKHFNSGGTVFDTIAIKNNTSIPSGYIKFVTPIKAAINQMFSIDIVGYDYSVGKSIDFTVVGYAYSGTDSVINIGFSNRSSFKKQVRVVLEDRGLGYRQMVIALGADDGAGTSAQAWYFQKFSATIRLWGGGATIYNTSDFSWVNGETTLSTGYWQSSNINNQWLDGQVGSINTNGVVTATTANFTNLTTSYLPKQTASGLVNSQIFDNGTNVGIGEQNPSFLFNVVGYTTYPVARFRQGSSWNDTNYALYVDGYSYLSGFRINGDDPQRGLYAKSNRQLGFATDAAAITFSTQASSERMRITADGNVGIGTTDPGQYKLNVNGDLKASNGFFDSVIIGAYGIIRSVSHEPLATYDPMSYTYHYAGASVDISMQGDVSAGSYRTWFGTSSQLLVADGTVIDKSELTTYAAETITNPSGTLTLKLATETVITNTLTSSDSISISLPSPTSGRVNESILIFKIGASLPTITQPSGIVYRISVPALAINSTWTFVYEQVWTGSAWEIYCSTAKNV